MTSGDVARRYLVGKAKWPGQAQPTGHVSGLWLNDVMEKVTPARLAKEFGIGYQEMFKRIREMKMPYIRMSAQITAADVERLRKQDAGLRRTADQRAAKFAVNQVATPPTPPTPKPVQGFDKTCTCCDRRWQFEAIEDRPRPVCPDCASHYARQDEDLGRALARSMSHEQMCRADLETTQDQLRRIAIERREAYEKRAKWRNALIEVVLDHEEGPSGACWCGSVPCRTWRKLEETNTGIHRQMEIWGSMSADQLERVMYPVTDW